MVGKAKRDNRRKHRNAKRNTGRYLAKIQNLIEAQLCAINYASGQPQQCQGCRGFMVDQTWRQFEDDMKRAEQMGQLYYAAHIQSTWNSLRNNLPYFPVPQQPHPAQPSSSNASNYNFDDEDLELEEILNQMQHIV
jgi:hypothetical protein